MSSLATHLGFGVALGFLFVSINPLIFAVCIFYSILPDLVRVIIRRFTGVETRVSHLPMFAFVFCIPLCLIGFNWALAGLIAYLLHLAEDGRTWERE